MLEGEAGDGKCVITQRCNCEIQRNVVMRDADVVCWRQDWREMRICDLGELQRYRPWEITLHSSLENAIRVQSFPLNFSVLFCPACPWSRPGGRHRFPVTLIHTSHIKLFSIFSQFCHRRCHARISETT